MFVGAGHDWKLGIKLAYVEADESVISGSDNVGIILEHGWLNSYGTI